MDGLINFTGSLSGNIDEGGGSGVTPHVTATASVNDQTGVPGVTVVRSGTDEAPNFDFNFVNLKGEDGAPGAQGPQGLTGATGPAGAQGPRGFTGATGATGPAGADGYSPAVSVTDIPGGHRVTITDETHPLGVSFDVMDGTDGTDGQDGSPGPQGPQGQPGAGVPEGGTVGQILTKAAAVDYDTEWMDNEAAAVDYDNTQSGLAADNVQAAVDEINSSLTQKESDNYLFTISDGVQYTLKIPNLYRGVLIMTTSSSGRSGIYVITATSQGGTTAHALVAANDTTFNTATNNELKITTTGSRNCLLIDVQQHPTVIPT